MKRFAFCLLLVSGATQHAIAAGIVRIANGDCAGLAAAAGSPPGQEPALIVLASKGSYDGCILSVSGRITIDGAGAAFSIPQPVSPLGGYDITVSGNLTLRNINLGVSTAPMAKAKALVKAPPVQPDFPLFSGNPIENNGTLTLESVSLSGTAYSGGEDVIPPFAVIDNSGDLILRNVSIAYNAETDGTALVGNSGSVEISHSTLALNQTAVALFGGPGKITIANSVLANTGGANCLSSDGNPAGEFVSLGGNITNDDSCGFRSPGDRVVVDAGLADFGNHGGLAATLALNYNSAAVGNGVAANCEASDARGAARGQSHCDSGAYEFGGGAGQLAGSGMSGLYFNSSNNGHYVLVQRLAGDNALVMWNTFDQKGAFAWMYGVGSVTGASIHVTQMAQNLDGVLHPGGAVTGATPTLWGTVDLNFGDCLSANLNYASALPLFGSGSSNLQRLAFVDGLDCSN